MRLHVFARSPTMTALVMFLVPPLLGGCSESALGIPETISVTVGPGATPTYTWSGDGVFSVTVVRTSDPTTFVWAIVTPGRDDIHSPVTHGTVPDGAVQTASSETALTRGVPYRVTVTRLNEVSGSADFTP